MADGSFPGLVSRTRDVNSASNVLFTQLADNAGNAVSVTGNALDVNATVTLETAYVDDSAFTIGVDKVNAQGFLADETATDSVDEGDIGLARMTLDRRMIVAADQQGTWNIATVTTLTGITNDVNIADGGNSITVDGTVAATQSGTWVLGANSGVDIGDVTINNAAGAAAVNIQDGGNSITVDAVNLDIRDLTAASDNVAISDGTDTLAINTGGSINVVPTVAAITGATHDYDTAAAIASDATSNHDYTVVNTTFLLTSVIVSGSGNIKFEIQTGPVAGLATKAVGFLTGRQGDTKQLFFDPPIAVPVTSTGTVRVIRTNRQGSATDLYSTIVGIDI